MGPWLVELGKVFEDWSDRTDRGVIISPDIDGLVSAALVCQAFQAAVVGVYTTSHLVLLGESTPEQASDALWLDHDVSEPGVRCVGQHLIHLAPGDRLPRRHEVSFNPNGHFGQTFQDSFKGVTGRTRDKYPFGTAHMVAEYVGLDDPDPGTGCLALFAHIDSTWANALKYKANCEIWQGMMFPDSGLIARILDDYPMSGENLRQHRALVERLVDAGVVNRTSAVKGLVGLPEDWKSVGGRQVVGGQAANAPEQYLDNVRAVLGVVDDVLGTVTPIEGGPGIVLTGSVETPYPNRIHSMDALMVDEEIFSHAITNFRTVRYTTDLVLNPARLEAWRG